MNTNFSLQFFFKIFSAVKGKVLKTVKSFEFSYPMKQGLILDVSPELCVKLDYMKALCQLSLPFHDQPENFSNINFCSNDFINA